MADKLSNTLSDHIAKIETISMSTLGDSAVTNLAILDYVLISASKSGYVLVPFIHPSYSVWLVRNVVGSTTPTDCLACYQKR